MFVFLTLPAYFIVVTNLFRIVAMLLPKSIYQYHHLQVPALAVYIVHHHY